MYCGILVQSSKSLTRVMKRDVSFGIIDEGCLDISWMESTVRFSCHSQKYISFLARFPEIGFFLKLTPEDSFLNGSAIIQKQACQIIFETIPLSCLNLGIKFPSLPSFLPSLLLYLLSIITMCWVPTMSQALYKVFFFFNHYSFNYLHNTNRWSTSSQFYLQESWSLREAIQHAEGYTPGRWEIELDSTFVSSHAGPPSLPIRQLSDGARVDLTDEVMPSSLVSLLSDVGSWMGLLEEMLSDLLENRG